MIDPDRPYLVIAQTARAIAAAAVRAGAQVATIDFFADEDTKALAMLARRSGTLGEGFRLAPLTREIEAVERTLGPLAGLVLGSGFEDRPALIDGLATRWPLVAMGGPTVRAAKSPERLSATCQAIDVAFPEIADHVPASGQWLVKLHGGAGGLHVRTSPPGPLPKRLYAQRRVSGTPVSALCLGDAHGAQVLAYSEQWADPAEGAPYRYGGAVGPIALAAPLDRDIRRAANGLASRLMLRGIFSIDMLIDHGKWWLLEVNPRFGATIDMLDRFETPLFTAHVAAFQDKAVKTGLKDATIGAAQVVYASRRIACISKVDWPAWVHDRPSAGAMVPVDAPIATVTAEAADRQACRALLAERAAWLRQVCGGEHG